MHGMPDPNQVHTIIFDLLRLAWRFKRPFLLTACVGLIVKFGFHQDGIWPLLYALPFGIALEFLVAWILKDAWGWKHGRSILAVYYTLSGAVLGVCFSFPFLLCSDYLVPSPFATRAAAENTIGAIGLIFGAAFWPWYNVFRNKRQVQAGTRGSWGSSHGSARWATAAELQTAGLMKGKGLLLGRFNDSEGSKLLAWDAPGHLLTVAPTRSGKGLGAVIPNLLVWPGSVLVTDPKGENYSVTARIRRSMGQRVFALDPFEVSGPTCHFNPMDLMDAHSPDIGDEVAVLADMLIVPSAKDPFWEQSAKDFLKALLLFVACEATPEKRNLAYVRHLMMSGPEEWAAAIETMRQSTAAHGLLARYGNSIANMAEKTVQGVLSTAKSQTAFLDSPRLEKLLSKSDFDLADLRAGDLSVYLILPPDKLDTYRSFLRLVIGSALQACTRAQALSPYPALFLLDEFAQLGTMDPVKRAYTLLGGYGVKVWAFLQDMGQLQNLYKEGAQTFIANATVKQFFGVSDLKTAEEVSKMLGQETITIENFGENQGRNTGSGLSNSGASNNSGSSSGSSNTQSQTGRALLNPDEVMRLNKDREILILQAQRPIFAEKINYLTDPHLQGRFDENPMHKAPSANEDDFQVGQVTCPYCHRHNLIGRPTCEGCGGSLTQAHEVTV